MLSTAAGTETCATEVRSAGSWARLVCGLAAVFVLFHWSASTLGSDRGQAGIIVGAIVTAATLVVERMWFAATFRGAARALGLGAPGPSGLIASAVISALLLLIVPVYVVMTGARWTMDAGWWQRVPGLFAQAGIAEEVLFRGYLYGHVRRGRGFWRAATISMLPFMAVHLLMFVTMPWPVAAASLVLAIIISFPMAHLFELGHGTIWGPALLHFVVQGTVKSITLAGDAAVAFPLVWMLASAAIPALALFVRRPTSR